MRFSPACAGNGAFADGRRATTPVQPRVCGERIVRDRDTYGRFSPACAGNGAVCKRRQIAGTGSAPRVRGTGTARVHRRMLVAGSAPRVRGTGESRRSAATQTTVQPRVCGERLTVMLSDATLTSVQPRVCGERSKAPCRRITPDRFSPACAGNGLDACSAHARGSAPRVRGTVHGATSPSDDDGSAPRVRGTVLIPSQNATVQPRVCGERYGRCRVSRVGRFSPACAGNGEPGTGMHRTRFSPACAGNGIRMASPSPMQTVQPRVCGERERRLRARSRAVQPRVCGERTCFHPVDLTIVSRCQRTAPT